MSSSPAAAIVFVSLGSLNCFVDLYERYYVVVMNKVLESRPKYEHALGIRQRTHSRDNGIKCKAL